MSSSLDVWFTDYDFLLLSSGRERKQPAKILFHNTRHHSWQPWAGYTGRRKSLFSCQSQQRHPTHTHLCATRWRAQQGKEKEGRKDGWGKEGRKGSEKQVWLQGKTFCHRCQNPADCSFSHPNVLAIKFWENTLAHAHGLCKWKNTIICFWLLRNLLSCFQLYTPPPLHPSFPPSSPLQCFLLLKL